MWTEERNELLKKLWADGLSASQIAGRLGGITRNAVIGKVHRLGLTGRATTSRMRSVRAIRRRKPQSSDNLPQRHARRTMACPAAAAVQYKLPFPIHLDGGAAGLAPVPSLVEELNIPPVLRVNLLDLKECMCRWPIGDPHSEDFHFCGRQRGSGSSYCEHHARIATQPWRRK